MSTFKKLEDLRVWIHAREYYKKLIQIMNQTPFKNDFVLRDQFRRSGGGIMDNIAEGFGRGGNREFIQYLAIARGSTFESRSQLYRAFDHQYISEVSLNELLVDNENISAMIASLINYLNRSESKGFKYKSVEEDMELYLPNPQHTTHNSQPSTKA